MQSIQKKSFIILLNFILSFTISLKADDDSLDKIGPVFDDLKLGILVNNKNFKIYRSKNLGKGGLKDLKEYSEEEKIAFPKTVISMNFFGYKFPSYSSLEEFKLKEKYGFQFFHSYGNGVRTYLDGHDPYHPKDDIDSPSKLGKEAQKYFQLRDDGVDGGIDNFFKILEIVLDPNNQPVLFHCFGGRHRTGMIAMAIRYLQGGKWTDKIVAVEKGIKMNLAQFEYYKFNRSMFRKENIEFIKKVNNDPRFIDLKLKFHGLLQ